MTDPVKLDVPVTVDQPEVGDLFQQMTDAGSDVMDFHVHREPDPGKTFSVEAIDDVMTALKLFVGARIHARFQDAADPSAPGPSDMHVEVKITLDDKTFTVPAEVRPWYAVDGTHRRGAM